MSSSTSLPLLLVAASTALFLGCAPGAPADGVHREALSAAHDGQTYVVVGERWDFNAAGPSRPLLFSSPDASDFTARDDGLPAVPLNAVAHGSGVFLAVGGQLYQDPGGSDFKESSTALFSADGQTWTEAQGIPSEALVGVAFGEGTFVAVGKDGSTFRSQDGQSLTPGPKIDGFAIVHGVAFGAGKFVVYGEGSSVFVSSDGTSFSQVPTPVDDAYLDFAGGAFRGAGAAGFSGEDPGTMKNLYSADGLTWSGGAADAGVGAMAEMNGTFIGVTAGEILRSSDAQGWTSLGTFDENHWRYDVIAAGGKFVVVGRNEVSVSEDGETFESIPLD